MFIIIKNINANITIDDLERFVLPAVNGRFFQKKGSINAIKIFALKNRDKEEVERHGIVRVSCPTLKNRLIKSLNGQYLGYDKAVVAEYVMRRWHNDRRADRVTASDFSADKRSSDRRRLGLKKVTLCEKTNFEPIESHLLNALLGY